MRRSKKISKLRVTGICAGNSPVTGEFHAQMASNAENVPGFVSRQIYEHWDLPNVAGTKPKRKTAVGRKIDRHMQLNSARLELNPLWVV